MDQGDLHLRSAPMAPTCEGNARLASGKHPRTRVGIDPLFRLPPL